MSKKVLTGTDAADEIIGTLEGEKINGGDSGDTLFAGQGDDFINAGDGDDIIYGDAGNDYINGGDGFDTAAYTGSVSEYVNSSGVLNLSAGRGNTTILDAGIDGTDTLRNIEAIQFADYTYYLDGRNNAVLAESDSATTDEDTELSSINVLANDLDLDGDDLTVTDLDSSGSIGLFTLNPDGTISYNPSGSFEYLAVGETATDSVTYTVTDGNGSEVTSTLEITVQGVNDAPVAQDDSATTDEDTFVSGNVLTNDSDPDQSDTLSVVAQTDVAGSNGGTFTLSADGTFVFNPGEDFQYLNDGESATSSISYETTDEHGETVSANLTILVQGKNDTSPILNNSFENGLNDWETLGTVGISNNASDGALSAQLSTYSWYPEDSIEAFFGASLNSIDDIEPSATYGSAIKQSVYLQAGETVSFDWYFDGGDYLPYNDTSLYLNLGGSVMELTDIRAVGNYGDSGWQTSAMTADSSGIYDIGFAVVNSHDNALSSYLYIDNLFII